MRYRLMATYLRVPYHAGLGPDGNEVTLFSPDPPPDELGFTAAAGHWRKQVSLTDLDALWQSRLAGEYRGEPCLVLDDPRSVALGSEPVRHGEEVVGRVTSGGYGYAVGASIAYAYVPLALAEPGTAVAIDIFGDWVDGEVRADPLYDPKGERVR
jgi:4-methylaminobutanoate oxidase (formaldehyde-forming)